MESDQRAGFVVRHRRMTAAVAVIAVVGAMGCVRRTMTITTTPPQSLVFINDQDVGRSTVTTDFLWYGDYDIIIRKEGYKTLKTHWKIEAPWYQRIPMDLLAEVFYPGWLHDVHQRHFELAPATTPTQEELLGRAKETRERALSRRN